MKTIKGTPQAAAERLLVPASLLGEALEALKPFAAMHREGTPPEEVAVVRGVASDLTMLTSADFQRAHEVIVKANAHNQDQRNWLKLVWLIVHKYGGEIRLGAAECRVLEADWELLAYEDLETRECVFKARYKARKQKDGAAVRSSTLVKSPNPRLFHFGKCAVCGTLIADGKPPTEKPREAGMCSACASEKVGARG